MPLMLPALCRCMRTRRHKETQLAWQSHQAVQFHGFIVLPAMPVLLYLAWDHHYWKHRSSQRCFLVLSVLAWAFARVLSGCLFSDLCIACMPLPISRKTLPRMTLRLLHAPHSLTTCPTLTLTRLLFVPTCSQQQRPGYPSAYGSACYMNRMNEWRQR